MSKTYAILGGGGSFGIHAAKYLLENANPKKVIGIGRNPLRPEPFSLNIDKMEGYEYHARHVTYEFDLLMELLDEEKPDVIVNFAAQGEGAQVAVDLEAGRAVRPPRPTRRAIRGAGQCRRALDGRPELAMIPRPPHLPRFTPMRHP